jgi:hypothetical protein
MNSIKEINQIFDLPEFNGVDILIIDGEFGIHKIKAGLLQVYFRDSNLHFPQVPSDSLRKMIFSGNERIYPKEQSFPL